MSWGAAAMLAMWGMVLLGLSRLLLHGAGVWEISRLISFSERHPALSLFLPVLPGAGRLLVAREEAGAPRATRVGLAVVCGLCAAFLALLAVYLWWLAAEALLR